MAESTKQPRRAIGRVVKRKRAADGKPDITHEVLAVTEKLLVEFGLEELTVGDILEASGVSRTSFYAYFESKHSAVAALAERVVTEIYDELWTKVADPTTPVPPTAADAYDGLKTMFRSTIIRWRDHRAVLLAAAQGWRANPDAYASWSTNFRRYSEAMRGYIERVRETHDTTKEPSAVALATACEWVAESLLYVSTTGDAPELDDVDEAAATLATLIAGAVYFRP
jgi:TetR/AcrR family transcriptional regulator, ethionamide resistance regulator